MNLPSTFQRTIFYKGEDAVRRLGELGLTLQILERVVQAGEAGRANATDNDPVTAAGSDAYRYRVRALRDVLVRPPYNWTKHTIEGLEFTVSPSGQGIVTRAGDAAVCIEEASPQFSRSAGDAARHVVDVRAVVPLFLDPSWWNKPRSAAAAEVAQATELKLVTWYLLVHPVGDSVACELSRPTAIDDHGQVEGWLERIALPMLHLDAAPRQTDLESTPATADVVVERKRHGGSR